MPLAPTLQGTESKEVSRRIADRLGGFVLTDDDFAELTAIVMEIAGTYCGNRLVSALEGGYTLSGLATAAGAHVHQLAS